LDIVGQPQNFVRHSSPVTSLPSFNSGHVLDIKWTGVSGSLPLTSCIMVLEPVVISRMCGLQDQGVYVNISLKLLIKFLLTPCLLCTCSFFLRGYMIFHLTRSLLFTGINGNFKWQNYIWNNT
jgi:hypothetical protein